MTIRIEITDVTNEDKVSLVKLAKYLLETAGHQMVYQMPKESVKAKSSKETPVEFIKDFAEGNKKLAEERLGLLKNHIEEVENKSEHTIETLVKLDNEIKEKVKRKKTISDTVKEIEKPPISGGYEHCAAPIPPVSHMNFNTFMTRVTSLRHSGKIEEIDLLNIVRKHGLDKTHMLSTNPDLVPLVNADLDKFLEGK